MTRRNFIVWYLAALLTAFAVAVLVPLLVFIFPPEAGNKKGPVNVTLDKDPNSIGPGEALKFDAPKDSGFIMHGGGGDNYEGKIGFAGFLTKDDSGKLLAFASTCSHLGCSVAFSGADKRFNCPCHGSIFALNGEVVHGPAAAPLSTVSWQPGGAANQIVVDGITFTGVSS